MDAKFIRDRYGLQLVFTPKSADDIAVLSELVGSFPWTNSGNTLAVSSVIENDSVKSISVKRNTYINKKILGFLGFSFSDKSEMILAMKVSNGFVYILAGSGTYYFLKVAADEPLVSAPFSEMEVNISEARIFATDGDGNTTFEMPFADFTTVEKVNTLDKLELLLA